MSQKQEKSKLKNIIKECLCMKRGFVTKIPRHKNVIFTMTGGIDSSVGAEMVIKKWGCVIYPFYLKRGATAEKWEMEAVTKIVKYLKNKYPKNIKDVFMAESPVPPQEIKKNLSIKRIVSKGHPLRNPIIYNIAVQYGTALNDKGITLSTVLLGSVYSDYFPGSRPIDLLIDTLHVCVNLEEWGWQIMSPFFQSGLLAKKKFIKKIDLIRWGIRNNFPLYLTRTCTRKDELSCGQCEECKERLETFKTLGVNDLIRYKL